MITISSPAAGSRIGPGTALQAATSTFGPYPIDSYWRATILDLGSGNILCESSYVNVFSVPTASFTWGIMDADPAGFPQPLVNGSADGNACSVVLVYRQHSGVVIDGPTTFGGYFWDAVSGLHFLISAPSSSVADIRRAVYRVFS